MKKVIFCLFIPVMIQSCTDEMHEINSVVSLTDDSIVGSDLRISSKDIPNDAFTAFYYFLENNKTNVENKVEGNINHNFDNSEPGKKDFTAYWEGN